MKNLFNKLLGKKEQIQEAYYPATFTIGWELHTKDGTVQKRTYEDVSYDERSKVADLIEKETSDMHTALNEAAKQNIEFVNLQGSIFRLSDVIKIGVTNKQN